MPPKAAPVAIRPEDFIEVMLDQRVQDAMAANTSGALALMVREILNKELVAIHRTCADLKKENTALKHALTALENSHATISKANAELSVRIETQECYSRRENIVIRGLPEASFAELGTRSNDCSSQDMIPVGSSLPVEQAVIELCRDRLGIDVLPSEISSAHRIRKGDKDTTRPVIVRFVCTKTRDKIMRAKKQLKSAGNRIYISEHLTFAASKCFYEARKLVREKKIESAWTMNGQVYFKRTASATEKPTLMTPGLTI